MRTDWDYIRKLGGEGILKRSDIQDLTSQRERVLWLMLDGLWHRASDIIRVAGGSEGLRRLRELRDIDGAVIDRVRVHGSREFVYRLHFEAGHQTDWLDHIHYSKQEEHK